MHDEARGIAEDIVRRLVEGWEAADGEAFAAPFSEGADFVNVRGELHQTREAIARGHQHIFDTIYRGSVVRMALLDARRMADGVILAHTRNTLDVPAGPMAGTHLATASLVLVRGAAGWRIDAYHNTLVQA